MKFSKDDIKKLILEEMSILSEQPQQDQFAADQNEDMLSDLSKVVNNFEKALNPMVKDMKSMGFDPSRSLDKANVVINMMGLFSQYHQQIQPLAQQIQQAQQQQQDQMAGVQGMEE